MIIPLSDLRELRGRVALVGGSFDPVHAGHVAYLRAARRLAGCDLVCAVASDEEVSQKHPVVVPATNRAAVVDALDGVTWTVIQDASGCLGVLKRLAPTHYIKGADWAGRLPVDQVAACVALGTHLAFTETPVESSSTLLRAYQQRASEQAVCAFETFVRAQSVPPPWTPVTDYGLEARRVAEGKHPELIRDVFQPRTVLDYGAGFGHLVMFLRELGIECVGYEPNPSRNALYLSHEAAEVPLSDLVICREVFEHVRLADWLTLVDRIVSRALRFIYVTTRFHPDPSHLLDVTTDGHREIDPTEITFATKDFLRALFVLHGCKIRPDLEAKMDWKGLGRCLVFEVA